MDEIAQAINELAQAVKTLKPASNSFLEWIKSIGTIAAAALALFGIYKILQEFKNQKQN